MLSVGYPYTSLRATDHSRREERSEEFPEKKKEKKRERGNVTKGKNERIRDHTIIYMDAHTRKNNLEEHVYMDKTDGNNRVISLEYQCLYVCVCVCMYVYMCIIRKLNEISIRICVPQVEMNLNRKSLRGPTANHSNIIRTRQRDCASPRHRFCISLTTVNIYNNLIYILLVYI